ncbi:MAG: hypothetical protein AB8G22_21820 [Saprospiraceae bacterium]
MNDYIRIYWILFDDGDLEVYQVDGNISDKRKSQIENNLNQIPFIKPFYREGDVTDMNGVIDIAFYENKEYENASTFYQLSIAKLGWINCDIFIEFDAPKIDLYVNADKDAIVKILFQNYDTVITPYRKDGKIYFSNIPVKEPIKIIAIKYDTENKGALYSITESIVQKEISELGPFQFLSLKELKTKIETLN